MPHTRQDWFFTKLKLPRVWDEGKVKPYQDKLRNRQEQLAQAQISESSSNAEKNRALKEQDKNAKVLKELADWERDVAFPLAAQRLEIDLDDGVKVNYAKFGKALAKVAGLN